VLVVPLLEDSVYVLDVDVGDEDVDVVVDVDEEDVLLVLALEDEVLDLVVFVVVLPVVLFLPRPVPVLWCSRKTCLWW
jgi:tRNA-binding EMAP/Myf-like protein